MSKVFFMLVVIMAAGIHPTPLLWLRLPSRPVALADDLECLLVQLQLPGNAQTVEG